MVGADRIAANGDVANKIGTYPLALAAARAGIPFVVAAPESTVDLDTPDGAAIAIEERAAAEVLRGRRRRGGPGGDRAEPGVRRDPRRPRHRDRHGGQGLALAGDTRMDILGDHDGAATTRPCSRAAAASRSS